MPNTYEKLATALAKLPTPRPAADPYLKYLLRLCADYAKRSLDEQQHREAFYQLWDEYLSFKTIQPPHFEHAGLHKEIEAIFDEMGRGSRFSRTTY